MKLNKLLQLLRDNAQPRAEGDAALAIRADASTEGELHLYLYDVIDSWFGASASALIAALADAGDRTVHLHINSPGGDVFEGLAMSAAIAAHPTPVHGHIDGLAASAATGVALACSTLDMTEGGLFMIHNAWTIALGDKVDMRATANLLDKVDSGIVATYMRATGKARDQVVGWMDAETWFTADEALAEGFVDSLVKPTQRESAPAARAASSWNLSAYANAPAPASSTEPDDAATTAAAAQQMQLNRNRLRLLAQI